MEDLNIGTFRLEFPDEEEDVCVKYIYTPDDCYYVQFEELEDWVKTVRFELDKPEDQYTIVYKGEV